jgi:F420-non-reducing hydrogenase small subunit
MSKPKIAFYWCASCGGCEEAVVDLNEAVLDVVAVFDIVFWPVALDFKRYDIEALPDKSIAVSFINGAIRNSEQFEMVEMLRSKSQTVVAFGSCAHLGGIPGLANITNRAEILEEVYSKSPAVVNENGNAPREEIQVPEGMLELPSLWDTVKTLNQAIDVDYYLPGCPPPVKIIKAAVDAIVKGELPPKGSVLAPDIALCEECPRKDTKPEKILLKEFKRPHEMNVDPEQCLLTQGLLCLGMVTRKGCDAACINANMPCTGCMGPISRARDFGAKALSSVASLADSNDEAEIAKILGRIVDPLGTFYRYSLPASMIHRSLQKSAQQGEK